MHAREVDLNCLIEKMKNANNLLRINDLIESSKNQGNYFKFIKYVQLELKDTSKWDHLDYRLIPSFLSSVFPSLRDNKSLSVKQKEVIRSFLELSVEAINSLHENMKISQDAFITDIITISCFFCDYIQDTNTARELISEINMYEKSLEHLEMLIFLYIRLGYGLSHVQAAVKALPKLQKADGFVATVARIGAKLNEDEGDEFAELAEFCMELAENIGQDDVELLYSVALVWERQFGDIMRAQSVFSKKYRDHDYFYFFESHEGVRHSIPYLIADIPLSPKSKKTDYFIKYVDHMRLKENNPDLFYKILNWD